MLKNINWGTLLLSKTFWGGLSVLAGAAAHAYSIWLTGQKATAVAELVAALGVFLGAIGIKDATSGPVN